MSSVKHRQLVMFPHFRKAAGFMRGLQQALISLDIKVLKMSKCLDFIAE